MVDDTELRHRLNELHYQVKENERLLFHVVTQIEKLVKYMEEEIEDDEQLDNEEVEIKNGAGKTSRVRETD